MFFDIYYSTFLSSQYNFSVERDFQQGNFKTDKYYRQVVELLFV